MRDSEVVASIVAGDPEGLATAYDRYADPLYKYCRTLLSDPADAADAVQDTFVIAASRLDGLRDPGRLRAWLYSVARNECLRILRSQKGTSALDEAPDVTDDSAYVSEEAERADLRALFEDAKDGLNAGDREVIELQLRHGLEAGEVADVLGVSRNHAHTLLSRARDQLETCLAVLLVSRAGGDDCTELGTMLGDWDGRLTVLLRKRLHRHIAHCSTCTGRRDLALSPGMLDLGAGAALVAGAAASFGAAVGVPAALRGHTLALATGRGPAAVAHQAAVLSRAGTFGRNGFPKPVHEAAKAGFAAHHGAGGGLKAGPRSSPRAQAIAGAAVVVVVAVAATAFALSGNNGTAKKAAGPKPPVTSAPLPPSSATAAATPAPTKPKPAEPATTPAPAPALAATTRAATPTPTSPSPTPTPTTPTPTPTTPTPTPTTPTPTSGTLTISPATLIYVTPGAPGTPITLHGAGGSGQWTVSWTVTVANGPGNVISLSAASGTLTNNSPTATVTVTASEPGYNCSPHSSQDPCPTLTFSPGGTTVHVMIFGPTVRHDGYGELPAAAAPTAAGPATLPTAAPSVSVTVAPSRREP